jgi:hypothetical protein
MKKIVTLACAILIATTGVFAQNRVNQNPKPVPTNEGIKDPKDNGIKTPTTPAPTTPSTPAPTTPSTKTPTGGDVKTGTGTNDVKDLPVKDMGSKTPTKTPTDVKGNDGDKDDVKGGNNEGPKSKDDKHLNAEEHSKGHAYSGQGKGGDKNIVDPDKKDKKDKKAKKPKKDKKHKEDKDHHGHDKHDNHEHENKGKN